MICFIDKSLVRTYVKFAKELHREFMNNKYRNSDVSKTISENSKTKRDCYLEEARKLKKESKL